MLTTTKAATTSSTSACTTWKSSSSTQLTSSEPIPDIPKAVSTMAVLTSMPETSRPETVTIGPSALRNTWRRSTANRGAPRLSATSTCSRPSWSSIALRVTRVTRAMKVTESAIAGSTTWCSWSSRPVPLPMVGNQPSFTPNTDRSTIAAAKDGTAAPTVTSSSTALSVRVPRRSAPSAPAPMPTTAISTVATATSSSDAGSRDQMTAPTLWWNR